MKVTATVKHEYDFTDQIALANEERLSAGEEPMTEREIQDFVLGDVLGVHPGSQENVHVSIGTQPDVPKDIAPAAQTVAAIADWYYAKYKEQSDEAYTKFNAQVAGFPGIWSYVANFAVKVDELLATEWAEEWRDFLDDAHDAAGYLAQHTAARGFSIPEKELAARFVQMLNPNQNYDNADAT